MSMKTKVHFELCFSKGSWGRCEASLWNQVLIFVQHLAHQLKWVPPEKLWSSGLLKCRDTNDLCCMLWMRKTRRNVFLRIQLWVTEANLSGCDTLPFPLHCLIRALQLSSAVFSLWNSRTDSISSSQNRSHTFCQRRWGHLPKTAADQGAQLQVPNIRLSLSSLLQHVCSAHPWRIRHDSWKSAVSVPFNR